MNRVLTVVVAVACVVLAVFLCILSPTTMQKIQGGFLDLISPFLRTGSAVQNQLDAENRDLTTENQKLRATNQILRDIEGENNKLRAALDYRQRSVFKLVPAHVISHDASTWWNTVKINRGFADGIEADQPVLTDVGLIGKTITVAKNETIVLLLTDETCKVAVKVEGTHEQGILSGRRVQDAKGSGETELNFLSKSADLQPGQNVYTVGVNNGVFPSGILVGKVKSFQARALDGQAITVPAVDASSVEDVFVVVGAK